MSIMGNALAAEHLADALARADLSPNARREVDALSGGLDGLSRGHNLLEDRLRAIDNDAELSEVARGRRREEAVRAWEAATDRYVSDLEGRAARLVPDAERQLVPPATATFADAAFIEARLSNARADVRMLLDDVPPVALLDRMSELARSTAYPAVAQLLSTTEFGQMYLEARGAPGEVGPWNERRLEALRPRLAPAAQRVLDDLPALRDAAALAPHLRGIFTAQRQRLGVRQG